MKKKESKSERFNSLEDFGRSLSLSSLDMQMIGQKKLLISKLKEARTKKGLSQASVAATVGSKQPAIARMEAGQVSQVSMDFLLKVALSLGVEFHFPATRRSLAA
jgi:DNA-binding XRE family transcriptional regulator